jgi:gamma-glutamyltranspeptidase / glutathione hydrolase
MVRTSLIVVLALLATAVFAQTPQNLYGRSADGPNGVVAAAKPEASQVGIEILKKGGNAVDAAVATGFALGVIEPNATGLGGGGFMVIKLANMNQAVVIDFREAAPGAAKPDMYALDAKGAPLNEASTVGGLATGVPGEVAGLLYALDNYGTMKRAEVIQPAIDWAEKGIPVTVNLTSIIKDNFDKIRKFPADAAIYLKNGLPYEEGDRIVNKDLANTLRLVAREGVAGFYQGPLAQKIAAEVQSTGGILTEADLRNYQVKIRKPVTGTYRGYTIVSCPPASSGGTHIIEQLNLLENLDVKALGYGTARSYHAWSEVMKLVFADRAKYMADTDFVKVPLAGLTSKAYARELFKKIDMAKPMATVEAGDAWKYESGSTTHFSVMDKAGNVVAVTKSINYFFGSGVVIPGTGFIMNNHMDDFTFKPGTANSIEPGKRPLSSMSPTMVLDPQGRAFMTIGSPGATRIIPTVAQVISAVIDHGVAIQDAIMAPRVFRMASGPMQIEGRVPPAVVAELKAMGHEVNVRAEWDAYFGGVHAIVYDYAKGVLRGGADPRRDGQAAAY